VNLETMMAFKQSGISSEKYFSNEFHRKLRTWVLVAKPDRVQIFEENNQKFELVDQSVSSLSMGCVTQCILGYKHRIHFQYNPEFYMRKRNNEHLTFFHKVSARLDEALWNERFDCLTLSGVPEILEALYQTFSLPVRARITETYKKIPCNKREK